MSKIMKFSLLTLIILAIVWVYAMVWIDKNGKPDLYCALKYSSDVIPAGMPKHSKVEVDFSDPVQAYVENTIYFGILPKEKNHDEIARKITKEYEVVFLGSKDAPYI